MMVGLDQSCHLGLVVSETEGGGYKEIKARW